MHQLERKELTATNRAAHTQTPWGRKPATGAHLTCRHGDWQTAAAGGRKESFERRGQASHESVNDDNGMNYACLSNNNDNDISYLFHEIFFFIFIGLLVYWFLVVLAATVFDRGPIETRESLLCPTLTKAAMTVATTDRFRTLSTACDEDALGKEIHRRVPVSTNILATTTCRSSLEKMGRRRSTARVIGL